MCPRCGQAVERDGVHECVDRSEYTYEGGYSKMRSVEELEKLPTAYSSYSLRDSRNLFFISNPINRSFSYILGKLLH